MNERAKTGAYILIAVDLHHDGLGSVLRDMMSTREAEAFA